MTDPLEALRLPVTPTDPDPEFVARLRSRLELQLRGAAAVTATRVTPYLAVSDARRAIEWYADVWGAEPTMDPVVMPDGKIGHVELRIGDTVVMLADEFAGIGFVAPAESSPVSLHVTVADAEAAVTRAAAAGAEVTRPLESYPHGLQAGLRDPFGHRWIVSQPPAPVADVPAGKHGDIGYFTFGVPDTGKAKAFYGELLGWTFTPGRVPDGFDIGGVTPMGGLWGGRGAWSVTLVYRVDDAEAAAARVRALGGDAGSGQRMPYGVLVECTDDQGIPFQLWQP